MAEAEQKDIILNIITQLKSKDSDKHLAAVERIKKEYGSLTTFLKAVKVEYGSLSRAILSVERQGKRGRISSEEYAKAELSAEKSILNYRLAEVRMRNQEKAERERLMKLKKAEKELARVQREEEKKALMEQKKIREELAKQERLRGARLGYNLSLLFTSWTVSRKINAVLDSWFKNYMRVTQGQTEFSNSVNKATAAMSFLGFVIFDTFSKQPLVQKMVDAFIKLVDATAEFVSAHPKITMSVVMGAFVIKTLADLIGMVTQFIMLKDAWNSLSNAKDVALSASMKLADSSKGLASWLIGGQKSVIVPITLTLTKLALGAAVIAAAAVGGWKLGELLAKFTSVKFRYDFVKYFAQVFDTLDDIYKNKVTQTIIKSTLSLLGPVGKYISDNLLDKISPANVYKQVFGQGKWLPDDVLKEYEKYEKLTKELGVDKIKSLEEVENKFSDISINIEGINTNLVDNQTNLDELKQKAVELQQIDPFSSWKQSLDEFNHKLGETRSLLDNVNMSLRDFFGSTLYSPHGG